MTKVVGPVAGILTVLLWVPAIERARRQSEEGKNDDLEVTASNLPVWLCVSSGVGTLLLVGWFQGSLAAAAPAAFGAVCGSAVAGLVWRAAQRAVERARSGSSGD